MHSIVGIAGPDAWVGNLDMAVIWRTSVSKQYRHISKSYRHISMNCQIDMQLARSREQNILSSIVVINLGSTLPISPSHLRLILLPAHYPILFRSLATHHPQQYRKYSQLYHILSDGNHLASTLPSCPLIHNPFLIILPYWLNKIPSPFCTPSSHCPRQYFFEAQWNVPKPCFLPSQQLPKYEEPSGHTNLPYPWYSPFYHMPSQTDPFGKRATPMPWGAQLLKLISPQYDLPSLQVILALFSGQFLRTTVYDLDSSPGQLMMAVPVTSQAYLLNSPSQVQQFYVLRTLPKPSILPQLISPSYMNLWAMEEYRPFPDGTESNSPQQQYQSFLYWIPLPLGQPLGSHYPQQYRSLALCLRSCLSEPKLRKSDMYGKRTLDVVEDIFDEVMQIGIFCDCGLIEGPGRRIDYNFQHPTRLSHIITNAAHTTQFQIITNPPIPTPAVNKHTQHNFTYAQYETGMMVRSLMGVG